VIGERHVVVAEVGRLAGHLLDAGAAVGPVGVQVEVALEEAADLGARTLVGRGLGLEAREVLGHDPLERLLDHLPGARADARDRLEGAAVGQRAQLVFGCVADGLGGAPERLLLVAAGLLALEQRGDTVERGNGIHAPIFAGGRATCVRRRVRRGRGRRRRGRSATARRRRRLRR